MSNKLSRLRKKAVKRFFKSYKSFCIKNTKILHLKKRLVTIHPCADEKILGKAEWSRESCLEVDGYFFYKNQLIFFKIYSPQMWCKNILTPQILPCFTWQKYQSIRWKMYELSFFTSHSPITLDLVNVVAKFIERWIDTHKELQLSDSVMTNIIGDVTELCLSEV